MKKDILIVVLLVAATIAGVAVLRQSGGRKGELTSIRIGWSSVWLPEGQLVQVLKNTNVLETNGLTGKFDKFSQGGPLSEAALAGEEDVIFVGSGPALNLTSKSDNWQIVSRMEDYRTVIIVPQNSNIKTVNDLRGKVVASPFGSTPYVLSSIFFQKAGIDPKKDLSLRNVDILEQVNVVQKGNQNSWGEIAAFTSWDPTTAQFEEQGKARVLVLIPDTGVVVMSKKFYEVHPEAAKNFFKSLIQSYDFYYGNKGVVNNWYLKDTGANFSQKVMETAASLERNNKANGIKEITLDLGDLDISNMQEEADQAFELGILKKRLDVKSIANQTFIRLAESEIKKGNFSKLVVSSQ
jgi:ABC-type nitrate/sulfonate/bicarbonate transport system substrate-binding protein